jgi:hypothetical protein
LRHHRRVFAGRRFGRGFGRALRRAALAVPWRDAPPVVKFPHRIAENRMGDP